MKVLKWLDEHFEEFFLVVILVLISCVELVQVIFRNLSFVDALTWPEEFCRFCWIWSVFLSLPYTIRKGSMLRVNVLVDMLPQAVRKSVNILIDLINAAVMAILFVNAIQVVNGIKVSGEASPAMLWPMWIIYAIMLVGFGLGAVRGVQMAIVHVMHFKEKELTTLEQTMAEAAEEAEAGKRAEGGEA
ncbi:MAG: TRAP transporter small permease [Oscillospiraceae bacterium]|nr:TRAP transporter small permease [Oscillospiraceae bacterium]